MHVRPSRVWFLRDLIHKEGTNSLGQKCITHASIKGDYSLFEKIVRGVGVRLFVVGYYLKYCPHSGAITQGRRFIEGRLLFEEMLHQLCPCWHCVHGVILIRIPKLY